MRTEPTQRGGEPAAAPGPAQRSTTPERTTDRDQNAPSGAQNAFGDFAPALVGLTDEVLFGQVWERPELAPRDRSLLTVASLTATGNTDQLVFHLGLAKRNGVTEDELIEAITHLAFYAGWPKAMSAMTVAKRIFRAD